MSMGMSDEDQKTLDNVSTQNFESGYVPGASDAMAEWDRKRAEADRKKTAETQRVTGEIRPTTQTSAERTTAETQRAKQKANDTWG